MDYDAIVIGTGQAGVPLSYALADHGWNVAVVEQGPLGGTCVNTGCTPSKTLIHRAQVAHYARNASRWGVRASDVGVDLPAIVAQKNKILQGRHAGQQKKFDEHPRLHLHRGKAVFAGPHQIQVDGKPLASERIFINTGARPMIPPIPGLQESGYLTNAEILDLTVLPEHLIVLGGGYIGMELGQMVARFGSRVTIVHRGAQILPREDPEIATELQRALEAEGIDFLLGAATTRVENKGGGIVLSLTRGGKPSTLAGSHLLVAVGRRPNTDALGLDRAGVDTDEHGSIRVNDRLETSVPGIWALGDVNGGPAFTHISYNDYQIVFANLIEGKNLSTANRIVPYCVFTDPQLGGVGLTEKQARATGRRLKIGRAPMRWVARAEERDETAGLMKIVVDADDDRILGATVLSTDGGETVQILYALMLAGAPYTLLKGAVYIHPTFAEGLFFLMNDVKPVPE